MGRPALHAEKLHHYHRITTCLTEFLAITLHLLSTLHLDIIPLGTSLFAFYALATGVYLRVSLVQLRSDS